MTITGMTSAKVALLKAATTSFPLARGGAWMFSLRTRIHQVTQSAAPSSRPGTMPAMNSLEIETLAATPKTTKPMLGGMIGAMMLAADSSPAERAGS